MDGPKVKSIAADAAIEAVHDDDDREPTKEEIMEDIRLGIQEAKAGEGMPAREAIEALLKRVYGDADAD